MTVSIPGALFLATSLGVFLTFGWGVVAHFRSRATPAGMRLISLMSVLAIIVVAIQAWMATPKPLWVGVGMAVQLAALVLFLLAVRETRATRLTLAYDDDRPTFLVSTGPYRYIRHPFYTSYILFWMGCTIALRDLYLGVLTTIIFILYYVAAYREEAKFKSSALRDAYEDYRLNAGFLWPKPPGRS